MNVISLVSDPLPFPERTSLDPINIKNLSIPLDLIRFIFEEHISGLSKKGYLTLFARIRRLGYGWHALAEIFQMSCINARKLRVEDCFPAKSSLNFSDYPKPYEQLCKYNKLTALAYIRARPGKFHVLDLQYFEKLKIEEFDHLINEQPNIQALYVNGFAASIIASIHPLKKLNSFKIKDGELSDDQVEKIAAAHPHIESLYISGERISKTIIPMLAPLKLKKLSLWHCPLLSDETIETLISQHSNLNCLHIVNSTITNIALAAIVKIPCLTDLKLMNCVYIQDFSPIGEISNLQKLSIGYCSDAQNFEFLYRLKNLKILRMPWYKCLPKDSRPCLEKLIKNGVKLKLNIQVPSYA